MLPDRTTPRDQSCPVLLSLLQNAATNIIVLIIGPFISESLALIGSMMIVVAYCLACSSSFSTRLHSAGLHSAARRSGSALDSPCELQDILPDAGSASLARVHARGIGPCFVKEHLLWLYAHCSGTLSPFYP